MDSQQDNLAINSIIEQISSTAYFQKRFNYTFNFALVIITALAYLNIVLSVATPDHWCHVPGREDTNYTLNEWKEMTIPMEVDSKGGLSYSKCKRFVTTNKTSETSEYSTSTTEDVKIVKCDQGWDYDRTWYERTASMQNDWVCDNAMVPANAIALGCIGEGIGTLIFGQLADNFGRMPVLLLTVATFVFGRIMSSLTSSWRYAFFIFSFIGSMAPVSVTQSVLVIGMEISRAEDRAWVTMLMCYGWIVGSMIMPLIMWWLRDWVPFLILTTLPSAVFLFSKPWLIESPRWLATKGKFKRCIQELGKMARMNNTQVPSNAELVLRQSQARNWEDKYYTALSLFSSARLAKNTTVIISCWTALAITHFSLSVGVWNLGGNPFLNYFFQAMAEIPGNFFGKYISDRYGRRFASFICFLFIVCGCIPILLLVNDPENFIVVSVLCIFLKFSASLGLYSINLQILEIYPTCIRQTGLAMSVIISSTFGVLSPYVISLGVTEIAMLPYIFYCVLSLAAGISSIFLPETLGQQLPESLEDAAKFGADQDIWGRKKFGQVQSKDRAAVPLNEVA